MVVTGGGGGLGRAISREFARAGASVAIIDSSAVATEEASAQIHASGGQCQPFVADVASPEAVDSVIDQISDQLGDISILVANAGTYPNTPFLEIEEQEWDDVIDANLKGVFITCQHVARRMKETGGGAVVTVSSGVARSALHGWAHYAASKAGILGLTRSMALELGPHGIRVNAIMPGYFEVGAGGEHLGSEYRSAAGASNALTRPGGVQELASAVLLLASPLASFVTGAVLPVDGGSSAGRIGVWPR